MLQYLTIDMVWLIVKSKLGSRFQSWHQNFNLNKKTTKTVVINLGAVKRSDILGGQMCVFINRDKKDNEGKVSAVKGTETARRDDAMAKRNCKQESQAIKAMKQCERAALAAGARIGAVVSLKVDYRTHSHVQGLLAIVFEMKQSTGGISV